MLNQLYALVGVMIFIAISGDAWVIQGLARTYEAVPLAEAPRLGSLVEGAQIAFTGIFAAALEVCAPVLLAVVLTDVAFGVVSRVVPQLNVFAVGFPAKVPVGLVLVGASLPFVAGWLGDELQHSVVGRPAGAEGGGLMAEQQDREGNTQEARRGAQEGPGRALDGPQRRVVLIAALLALSAFGPMMSAGWPRRRSTSST